MSYPAYAETKASGVDWLGDVPQDWEVKRTRYVCHINPPKSEVSGLPPETMASFLPMEKVGTEGEIVLDENRAIEDVLQGFTYFRDGDIIAAKITPCFENGKGAIVSHLTNGIGFGSTEFHVLRPFRHYLPRFIFYLTRSQDFRSLGTASMYGAGGQKRVPEDFLEDFRMAFPPLPEQQQIAAFLDRKTAELDAVLALKERQLKLLAEKRQALISQAVTRGLDPTAPLKPSGIDWLGDVPRHWEVKRLKFLKSGSLMYGANEAAESDNPDMPRFIRITDLKDDGTLREDTFRSLPEDLAAPFMLEDGDFLFARSGATVGKAFMYSKTLGPSCFAGYLIRLRPLRKVLVPEFLNFYIKSAGYEDAVKEVSIQSTIQNVSAEKYANFTTLLPLVMEQHAIVAYLDRETASLDGVAQAIRAQIERVREYRQALISAAVTGKIDVRNL